MKSIKISQLRTPKQMSTKPIQKHTSSLSNSIFGQNGYRGSTAIRLNPTSWNQKAMYSTKSGEGMFIIPVDKKSYSYNMETSLSTRIPREDKTTKLTFTPPPGHIEDKQAAAKLGINSVFIHQDYYQNGSVPSMFLVSFDPHKESNASRSLDGYLEKIKIHFFIYNPSGTVSDVFIDRESLSDVLPEGEEIECKGLLQDYKKKPTDTIRSAQLSLFFKTPGGIWSVTCSAQHSAMMSDVESYIVPMLRNLRLELLAPATKEPLGVVTGRSILQRLPTSTAEVPTGAFQSLSFATASPSSTTTQSSSTINSRSSIPTPAGTSTTADEALPKSAPKLLTDEE